MLNLNNKSIMIFLIGIVSYLYLFSSILNKKYNVIFIYFTILFSGYFIIGNKIFLYNLLIIIIDIINNKFILREGNFDSSFEKGIDNTKKDEKLNKEGGSIELDGMDESGGEELGDKFNSKDNANQKKKDAASRATDNIK
tara:strand:+ start:3022 stop:3441 length:420 start_codon:yes stop_codon:yes gene_type:complete